MMIRISVFVIMVMTFASCFKKSTDQCPDEPVERSVNITYHAHWPATVNVESNYSDTIFIYHVDSTYVITTLDSGQTGTYEFAQYEKFNVYADVPDSLVSSVDSVVNVSVIYNCPSE